MHKAKVLYTIETEMRSIMMIALGFAEEWTAFLADEDGSIQNDDRYY